MNILSTKRLSFAVFCVLACTSAFGNNCTPEQLEKFLDAGMSASEVRTICFGAAPEESSGQGNPTSEAQIETSFCEQIQEIVSLDKAVAELIAKQSPLSIKHVGRTKFKNYATYNSSIQLPGASCILNVESILPKGKYEGSINYDMHCNWEFDNFDEVVSEGKQLTDALSACESVCTGDVVSGGDKEVGEEAWRHWFGINTESAQGLKVCPERIAEDSVKKKDVFGDGTKGFNVLINSFPGIEPGADQDRKPAAHWIELNIEYPYSSF